MRRLSLLGCALLALVGTVRAQDMPADYRAVLETLGKQGDFKANVLKINIPRNDLQVTVDGVRTPTPFGFGGWLAMTKGDGGACLMMGDLVLLEDEVNPVMSALLENGLEVTALHNHFFWEEPRIFYMHVMGHGDAAGLARMAKPAVDLIGRVPGRHRKLIMDAAAAPPEGSLNTDKIAQIIGRQGEQNGRVYKITVGRDDLQVKESGALINARMGLNTWAAFTGDDADAAMAGDVAMLEHEVTPVLKSMRKNGLEIVAIHHHMIRSHPLIIFLHYWGRGPAEKLAAGFKSTLDLLGKEKGASGATHPK